jgi:hypothetical protein
MHILMMLLVCGLMTACNENYSYKEDGPHQKFVDAYMPMVKVTREGVVHQIRVTNDNIDKLYATKKQFTQESTKNMLMTRINALFEQKKSLKEVLDRIDEEVERGIALHTFNQIEGGNTRKQTISHLTRQAQERVAAAQLLNNNIHNMHEEVVPIPRVQTIDAPRPPKVIPLR